MGTGYGTSDLGKLGEKPCIAYSQINKTEEQGGDRRPRRTWLAGSQ